LVALDSFRLTAGTPVASTSATNHQSLSGRSSADCHPTTAITDFNLTVNSLISNYFSSMTDYSFDLDATGSTTVDVGIDLSTRIIYVYENGVLKREGATYDFQKSGTLVVFNYTVKNSWVKVVISDVGVNEYSFDADSIGQTAFNVGFDMTAKRVIVLENGVQKREGITYDYTIAGSTVTFNYTVKNSWVRIIVYI
jgi:hypothetical protein